MASHSTSKKALYEQFARLGKALANPLRLELLDLLAQGERSVEELAEAAGARTGNTSAQLRVLSEAGLTVGRRAGSHVYYRLADESVGAFLETAKDLACARLAEAERAAAAYLGDLGEVEPIDREQLRRRARADEVRVIDVRPSPEYAAGHIPDAVSIPLDELEARLAELPRDREIVAYCRGRYCVYAPEAVRRLRARGYRARSLDGGLPEWRRAGLPVAVTAEPAR